MPSDPTYQCRVCWLFHNDERYRQLWTTGEGLVTSTAPAQAATPSLPERVGNFQTALERWNAAGRPRVSLEVLAERQAQCQSCEYHDAEHDLCNLCGCPLSQPPLIGQALALVTTGQKAASKSEMATESCPRDPPRWSATA